MKVTISQIPEFLKSSKFYESLLELDNDSFFEIQKEYFKEEIIVETNDDLISYIILFDYWMIDHISNDFYKVILDIKDKIDMNLLLDKFHMNELVEQIKIIIDMPNNKICSYLSSIGNLELLNYAHEKGYLLDILSCDNAASNGHLECLKYAYECICDWNDSKPCTNAAKNGHLDCLKYAHENGCKWDELTCAYAELFGHFKCLKYAVENGCPCNRPTYLWD
jgi:hypothetical protein